MEAWLLALFPRGFGGQAPWVQRLITNCCTVLPCLGVACGVPGESGTVLSVTGATGEDDRGGAFGVGWALDRQQNS